MLIEVLMPKHGLNMSEGLITLWTKQEGDAVKAGDMLFEFETEKATVEFESPADGILMQILAPVESSVPVNDTVCLIETEADKAAAPALAAAEEAAVLPDKQAASAAVSPAEEVPVATAAEKTTAAPDGYIPATPYVKHLAKSAGIPLAGLVGTGQNSRITPQDVAAAQVAAPALAATDQAPSPAATHAQAPAAVALADGEEIPLGRIKKITGERMAHSFATIPHIYFTARVNLEKLAQHRDALLRESGVKHSYSDFILLACSRALSKYPIANASYREGRLCAQSGVHVGFATATPKGLVVPVVHDTQMYTLPELARRRSTLVEKALAGKLEVAEMEGGTFTISNLGGFGIDSFDAIVNPPQAAILAVGSIADEAVVVDKAIRICPVVTLRLAADHRVLDGADCARFLGHIKKLLQLEETLA